MQNFLLIYASANSKNFNQNVNARKLKVFRKKFLCALQVLYRWYNNTRKE